MNAIDGRSSRSHERITCRTEHPATRLRPTRSIQFPRLLVALATAAVCSHAPAQNTPIETTFAKHVAIAEAGDAGSQNLLGYMLFFGEGAPRNWFAARAWFERAAANGSALATRNLAMLNQLQPPARPSGGAPNFKLRDSSPPAPGERVYQTFCAGCHGLNGIAAYIDSPSFALGEGLEKGAAALLHSVRNGTKTMAAWGDRLAEPEIAAVVAFLPKLKERYDHGISQALRSVPDKFYLFGPMRTNAIAFDIDDDNLFPRSDSRAN